MIPDIKVSTENTMTKVVSTETTMQKVWFIDVVTQYGPDCLHSVPVRIALEQCAEILNVEYTAVVDQNCPIFKGTEKWLRVLHFSRTGTLHDLFEDLAIPEIQSKLREFCDLWIRIRSLLKGINNNASCTIIRLDWGVNSYQKLAVFLSVASLLAARKNTIVWIHLDRSADRTKIARFRQRLLDIFPIKVWRTAYTSEIAAENKKYGRVVDILPLPLHPALSDFAYKHRSANKINLCHAKADKLVCWLFINRPEQGLALLPKIIDHPSVGAFPKKSIKCFVCEHASIKENAEIELVRLPYVSEEDYHLHFNKCEVVFLPYKTHSYSSSMSMVFIETIATSKIPIVSDGTAMARELRRFELGDLVIDFDTEFSWTLINKIRKDVSIRARVNLMAESYVREHGTFGYAHSLYKSLKRFNSKMALSEPKAGNLASIHVEP